MTDDIRQPGDAMTEAVALLSFFSHYLTRHFPETPPRTGYAPWEGHILFADMLVRSVRPRRLVELGTHTGVSFFAFCEAVRQAWLPTRCIAVDTWKGDEQAGFYGEEVYAGVAEQAEKHYPLIATLMRMPFDDALPCMEDASIDILHIDGLHTYEAVRHDFDAWLPKVRPGGIVLLHDVAEQREDFGVWKLWLEIAPLSPETCRFPHSHGLGVWRKPGGPALDDVFLRTLLAADPDASAAAQAMILHLNRQMRHQHRLAGLREQLAAAGEQARDLDRRRQAAETACADLHARLAEQQTHLADLHAHLAGQQAHLADLEQRQARLLASRSWRMTRPLRALASWARTLAHGHAGQPDRH